MGAVISLEDENIKQNELVKRLAGTEAISDNDPYWNKLFSFNFDIPQWSKSAQKQFLDGVEPLLQSLLYNAAASNNFAVLVKVFLRRCTELEASVKCKNKIFLWQATNSLIIFRYICVFFAERLSVSEFVNVFENRTKPSSDNEDDELRTLEEELRAVDATSTAAGGVFAGKAAEFLRALVNILCDLPINDLTRGIHHETYRVIFALLSTQLHSADVGPHSPFLQFLIDYSEKTTDLVRVCLQNFLYQFVEIADETRRSKSESLVLSLATSMWSAFQRSVMIASPDNGEDVNDAVASDEFSPQTLAALSTALLFHLVCCPLPQQPVAGHAQPDQRPPVVANQFKEKLSLFQNSQEVSSLANLQASFKLDFTALYNRLCERVDAGDQLAMLLLYFLLHNNCGFRNFVLSRINLENLIVPCIKALNAGVSPRNAANPAAFHAVSHHTYLALISMLILSEDDFFCKIIHEMKLQNVTFYQADRTITEISLGGLIVLILVKIIHVNTIKTRDRYLHTNTMAALANMAPYFKHLSPLVCQKLLDLLETMSKRQAKLIRQMVKHAEKSNDSSSGAPTADSGGADSSSEQSRRANESDQSREYKDMLNQDISVLEEGIRHILGMLNACLLNNLRTNIDLIYGILYRRQLFELYRNHPFYEDFVWNVYLVINHFAGKIEAHCTENGPSISPPTTPTTNAPGGIIVSVSDVMETIRKAAVEWPTDRLRKFPKLTFEYIEDENTVYFFVPYIWRLTNAAAGVYFNPAGIRLHGVLANDATEDGCNAETAAEKNETP